MGNRIKEKAVAIGYRIRERRKEMGFASQDSFIEALRDAGAGMSKVTLGRIEKGLLGDFSIIQALAMCEVLSCDMGYLLCEYDSKTVIAEEVSKYTGLNEQAIANLHTLTTGKGMLVSDKLMTRYVVPFINSLLSSTDIVKAISAKLNAYTAIADMKRNIAGEPDERTEMMQSGALFDLSRVLTNRVEQIFAPDNDIRKNHPVSY